MKRTLVICLFILMSEISGNCATTLFPPLQPVNGANEAKNYTGNNVTSFPDPFATANNNANYPNITKIEQSLFGHTYENQSISARLSRIEKSLFSKTFQDASAMQRIDNIISNYNQINKYPNISQNALSKLEKQVFNQNFSQNNAQRRIERLEEQLLGAVQSGDMDARFETLKIAAKAYKNQQKDEFFPNSGSGWQGLGNSMRGGTLTGFTPSISPFSNNTNRFNNYNRFNNNSNVLSQQTHTNYSNPYMRAYENPYSSYTSPTSNYYTTGGYGTNQGIRTNHGYYDGFSDFSSGTGVTILD